MREGGERLLAMTKILNTIVVRTRVVCICRCITHCLPPISAALSFFPYRRILLAMPYTLPCQLHLFSSLRCHFDVDWISLRPWERWSESIGNLLIIARHAPNQIADDDPTFLWRTSITRIYPLPIFARKCPRYAYSWSHPSASNAIRCLRN